MPFHSQMIGFLFIPEPLIKSTMSRVADKNGGLAATRYWRSQPFAGAAACCHSRTRRFAHRVMAAVILRCQGVQHSERPFLSQPAKPKARPCGTQSEVP